MPAAQERPGDIVLIEEGDTIHAAGQLIRSVALQTAGASLTGESQPVAKETQPLAEEGELASQHGWAGSVTP